MAVVVNTTRLETSSWDHFKHFDTIEIILTTFRKMVIMVENYHQPTAFLILMFFSLALGASCSEYTCSTIQSSGPELSHLVSSIIRKVDGIFPMSQSLR